MQELVDKGICDKGFNWNPSSCYCECDKSFDVGEYLNYKNFGKRLVDKFVEECNKNFDEKELHSNEMVYDSTLNYYKIVSYSCRVYIVLFAIFFIISISIS